MAASASTYANLRAHGIDSAGDVAPVFELFAGDTPKVATDQGQMADGVACSQFQVLMHDAEGKLIPFTISDNYNTGTVNITGIQTAADTVTINGNVITFITTGTPDVDEVLTSATIADTATRLAAVINSDPELYGATAVAAAGVVTLTSIAQGTAGAIVVSESAANLTVSGNLSGGDATADVPSNDATAVSCQAVAAATPGAFVPVYVAGCFNHEALLWPAGLATLRTRKLAFERSRGIVVKQLL